MAKQANTGTSSARTVRVVGRRKEDANGRAKMIVEVDGRSTTTRHKNATHQEAIYVATLKAMHRAHADGITDLSIDSPNDLVDGHINQGWKKGEDRLKPFQDEIELLRKEFDSVDWLDPASMLKQAAGQTRS